MKQHCTGPFLSLESLGNFPPRENCGSFLQVCVVCNFSKCVELMRVNSNFVVLDLFESNPDREEK